MIGMATLRLISRGMVPLAAPWDGVSPPEPSSIRAPGVTRFGHTPRIALRRRVWPGVPGSARCQLRSRPPTACDGEVRVGFPQFASQQFKGEFEFGICHVSTVPPTTGRGYARFGRDSWQITPR